MVSIRAVESLVRLFMYNTAIDKFNASQDIVYEDRMIFMLLCLYRGNNGYGMGLRELDRYLASYNHTCNRTILSSYLKICLANGLVVKSKRIWVISSLGKYKIKELERCIRSVRMRS